MESLAHLEVLCERLYNSQDSTERNHAESVLKCFSTSTEYIVQCQYILDNASTPYALMLASSSLLKQVNEHSLSVQLRLDIRNYLIKYLATRGPELQPFVVGSLIQLLCRLTKIGWFDDEKMKEIVEDCMNFLSQASADHYAIGLKILNQLVSEMNMSCPGLSATHNRKATCSFRDESLLKIFQTSLTSLRQLKNTDDHNFHAVLNRLQELALSLSLKCLSFDFVGTTIDESSDEFGTVQIPSPWRPFLEDHSTLQVFFQYYVESQSPLSKEALECLVRIASVRRSLFTNDAARSKFLYNLMSGTREVLKSGQGLAAHDNYHEFCRLLGRLKVNFQLSELVSIEGYSEWIRLVAEFTSKSLKSWQWASSSVYYLLTLWSKLVNSVPYLKGDSPSLLEEFVPKITEEFIVSRLEFVREGSLPDDLSCHPLDNVESLQDQLDCFPVLCRFNYETSSLFIINMMEPVAQAYGECVHRIPATVDLSIIEGKLAWIVHIIAAIFKIKQSYSSEAHEVMDAELSGRVLQLMKATDSGLHSRRYTELGKQRLDRALLTFFQNFRKSFVGDQAMHSSKHLYARLSDTLGLGDHLLLLDVIVGKIATNLKFYAASEDVIAHTLSLFFELASGYMTGKLLLKLDTVRFIAENHTKEHFPFLEEGMCSRTRTTFYYTVGSLIFMEDRTALLFRTFMEPFARSFARLESVGDDHLFRGDSVRQALTSLMRDMRGIAMAAGTRQSYAMLFEWLYPSHMPLILKGITYWMDTPELTTPLLKFLAEFVFNRAQRLVFDSSSPNGILLFREVSRFACAYATGLLSLPIPPTDDVYSRRYKGLWVLLMVLSRALSGNYVNFGVFELYGDKALADALDVAVRLVLSVPLNDVMAYRKLTKAYFSFLEVLFDGHIVFVAGLAADAFARVFTSLNSGLKSIDATVSSQCATCVDNLASFYFNCCVSSEAMAPRYPSAAARLSRHVADNRNAFAAVLETLFEIVLFEECSNHWSLSRPMLSLIVIDRQIFSDLRVNIIASQPPDQHARISHAFEKLMADVGPSLDSRNRDRFTHNLTFFRQDFRVK